MKYKHILKNSKFLLILFLVAAVSLGFIEGDKRGNRTDKKNYTLSKTNTGKVGDAYVMEINNITLPLNNRGVLADVNVGQTQAGGQFAGNIFLFSGGFFLTGNSNGELWEVPQLRHH